MKLKFKIGVTFEIFLGVIALYCLSMLLSQTLITKEVLLNTYGSSEFVEKITKQKQEYGWISYTLVPLIYSIKFLLIAITLNIGALLLNIKIKFGKLWRTVLLAELVTIFFGVITIVMLIFNNYSTIDEIREFDPFALSYYINTDNIPPFLKYPFSLLNLAEIVYWLILAKLMMPLLNKSFGKSLGFVAQTYGVGLLLWITLIVFLSLLL